MIGAPFAGAWDVAARRAVVTGANQMNMQMTDSIMNELGAEYVETSAHTGARPSHQNGKGKYFMSEEARMDIRILYHQPDMVMLPV